MSQFFIGTLFPPLYCPFAAIFVSAVSSGRSILFVPSVVTAIAGFIAIALCYHVRLGWKAFIPGALTFILLAPLIAFGVAAVVCGAIRL